MSISPGIQLGLIGYPLSHSLSPLLHQTALQSAGLSGEYQLWEIHPDRFEQGFKKLLDELRLGIITGLNVTIPYKERVTPHLDNLSQSAAAIGAVNTLYLSQGEIIGDNTDAYGFSRSLERYHFDSLAKHALVLGSGGAARSAVYSLLRHTWNVILAARNTKTRNKIEQDFSAGLAPGKLISIELLAEEIRPYLDDLQLVVNATPQGMMPDIYSSPWPADLKFPGQAVCFDLVYNPSSTRLMEIARLQGARVQNGVEMLVQQAAAAFKIWTGQQPSVSQMRQRLLESLMER